MSTAVLHEFRRRFVAATVKQDLVVSFVENADLEVSTGLHSIERNDRVLMFGPNSLDVLKNAARRAGSGSVILNVDDDITRVRESRGRIAAAENDEGEAAIRLVCADWSDLRTNLEWAEQRLQEEPVGSVTELLQFKDELVSKGRENPLIRDGCVNLAILPALNTIPHERVFPFLHEVWRSLENRGRLTLQCLVSDEPLSALDAATLGNSKEINHIPTEQQLLTSLEELGFHGIELTRWEEFPRHVIQTVEVRSVEVQAFKGKEGPCYDCHHAVIYRGPWRQVRDDDGHVYKRGERTAVCEKTYRLLTREPYQDDFIPLPPYIAVPLEQSIPFDCNGLSTRDPKVTKGLRSTESQTPAADCSSNCAC